MRDFKSHKAKSRVKGNRRKVQKAPRDWKRLFLRLLRVAVACGSLALVVSGGMLATRLLFASDYFRVTGIDVEHNRRLSSEELVALSGIKPGESLFRLDLEAIGHKIEENPWIATAQVARVFPHKVLISVSERAPKAIVNLGYLYYVDDGGTVFKLLDPGDRLDYPVITGIDRRFLLENPATARRELQDALRLIDDLAQRRGFNLSDASEVHIEPTGGIDLYTYVGGVSIRMGYGDFTTKLDHLERIFKELQPRLLALEYIDLNVLDRVIVKIDPECLHGRG